MKSAFEIHFFLALGYFPGYQQRHGYDFSAITAEIYKNQSLENLAEQGAAIWRDTISQKFEKNKRHVVPLSGGLDSRAILAGLMECTETYNIETYTFGTPGTLDYDLGCKVASEMGTKHMVIPLDKVEWCDHDFADAASRFSYQTLLFHHVPFHMLNQFCGANIWSGYLGDLVTGAHLPRLPSHDFKSAKIRYLKTRKIVQSVDLLGDRSSDLSHGIKNVICHTLSPDECVKFAEVEGFAAPHVLADGFHYQIPFINTPFFNFFMSVPNSLRFNQILYKEMLIKSWPKLFSLPVKSHCGLNLSAPFSKILMQKMRNRFSNIARSYFKNIDWPALPMTNYMDLDYVLRKDSILQEIVRPHLQDLAARQIVPWIDVNYLWQRHIMRKDNHGDA